MRFLPATIFLFLASACTAPPLPETAPPITPLTQIGATQPIPDDPDDPAVWFHPHDPPIEVAPGMLIAMNSRPRNFLIFAWPQRYATAPEKASLLR